MLFKEFGDVKKPTVILLHGGGLSWWSLQPVIALLEKDYHIVTPIIDGYGEDAGTTFVSIERSAENLIAYIDNNCGGRVFALAGLSIGAQIVVEALTQRADIAVYAVIESALVCPIPGTKAMTVPACRMSYGLIQKRWFSKLQAKELCVPEELFETYYADSVKISEQSLINTILSNGTYELKPKIQETKAKALIIAGEKENSVMRKSAQKLHEAIQGSKLYIAPKMKHGELSLCYPEQYVKLLIDSLNKTHNL